MGSTCTAAMSTSRNGAAVIVFPGSAGRAAQARVLVRHGYGVLMLDMRGYANSDGDPNMFGWSGTKDVDAGVAFLARRADVRDGRIGGLGFSVGGEVMIGGRGGEPRVCVQSSPTAPVSDRCASRDSVAARVGSRCRRIWCRRPPWPSSAATGRHRRSSISFPALRRVPCC